ncbi:ABC transporter permease [Luteibaculum oceani]|uniref:FtsX-like permease family protein n=1 Tax=Luteibaculum oceani TaxID=1294296 RepID=A0A5C6UQW9_9FLAO|nr:ABC transporter permease [Luteibaculum oceani]TXC75607.1 FtsX-like permease family protein [Luteibaculum oceani]
MILLKLLKESWVFAYQGLVLNKLRSLLSLLGITIGIFAIISVLTLVDSLEKGIRDGVATLGDDVIFIQKWPWGGGPNYEWWKFFKRPQPLPSEVRLLEAYDLPVLGIAYTGEFRRKVEYGKATLQGVSVNAVSTGYDKVKNLSISSGRYFTDKEIRGGSPLAIVGYGIAENFFGDSELALLKEIKIAGLRVTIIGVLEKEGDGIFGNSADETVVVPVNFAKSLTNVRNVDAAIMVKAAAGISNDQLKDELEGTMRAIRRIKPKEESDFALNESSLINNQLDEFFGVVNMAGFLIGFLSIIVGGFSIANIMFVSVKERTNLIGIQKALGAKNYFILLQFLFEAAFLAVVGGLIGLFVIFLMTVTVSTFTDFELALSFKNILLGVGISATIGVLSGIVPAFFASRLDPVIAIRSN